MTKKKIFKKLRKYFDSDERYFNCGDYKVENVLQCKDCPWNKSRYDYGKLSCDMKAYDEFEKYNKIKEILK